MQFLRHVGVRIGSVPLWVPVVFIATACALSGIGTAEGPLAAVLVGAAAVCVASMLFLGEYAVVPSIGASYAGVPLVLVALVSCWYSNQSPSFIFGGQNLDIGTLGFVLLFALVIILAASLPPSAPLIFLKTYISILFVRLALALVLAALVLWGLRSPHPATASTMRPSFSASAIVLAQPQLASLSYALFGMGPNSLPHAWNMYRPTQLNATAFWKEAPASAASGALSFVLLWGLLGLFVLAACPVLLLFLFLKHRSASGAHRHHALTRTGLLVVGLVPFGAMLVYPTGVSLLLAGAAAVGFSLRLDEPAAVLQQKRSLRVLCAVVVLLLGCVFVWIGVREALADYEFMRGQALVRSQPARAASQLERAAYWWPAPLYLSDAATVGVQAAIQTANDQATKGSVDGRALRSAIDQATGFIERSVNATSGNPLDPDLWIARASVYLGMASVNVPNAAQQASESLKHARQLAPTRADIVYDQAVLAIFLGNTTEARADLHAALELKPDYQGAIDLLSTLGN